MPSQTPSRRVHGFRSTTHCLRNTWLFVALLAVGTGVFAADRGKFKDNRRGTCATTYAVVQQDDSGNVEQGIANPKNRKWTDKELWKRYPDVCYVGNGSATKAILVITASDDARFTLTVETLANDGKPVIQRTFQQGGENGAGIYGAMIRTMYAPLPQKSRHPAKELIEEAVKWIHDGGLDDMFPR
jgi:hypothetical protein